MRLQRRMGSGGKSVTPGRLLSISILVFLAAVPMEAKVSRCSFDPACLCIEWSGAEGATIEIRCPSGSDDTGGWTTTGDFGGPTVVPDIVDPEGSWEGTGGFGGPGLLLGKPLTLEEQLDLGNAEFFAKRMINNDPECQKLLAGSPLTENGDWLLTKIQYRKGETVPGSLCSKPNVAAFARNVPQHEPIVYLCNLFFFLDAVGAGQVLIHEMLHVAGQSEDSTQSTGPGDAPSSEAIHDTVTAACNSF